MLLSLFSLSANTCIWLERAVGDLLLALLPQKTGLIFLRQR